MASVAAVGVALITIVASAYIGSHVLAGFGDVRVGVGMAGAVGAMGAQILRAYFVAGTRFVWLLQRAGGYQLPFHRLPFPEDGARCRSHHYSLGEEEEHRGVVDGDLHDHYINFVAPRGTAAASCSLRCS
jgi:hypothetical protein